MQSTRHKLKQFEYFDQWATEGDMYSLQILLYGTNHLYSVLQNHKGIFFNCFDFILMTA